MSKTTGTTPAGDYAGLVEKLNLPWPDYETEKVTLPAWVLELMAEAATALAAQDAKIAALATERDEAVRRGEDQWVLYVKEKCAREAAEARLAEVLKALEPLPVPVEWALDDDMVHVRVGDLRAARRVREGGKVDG